MSEEVAVVGWTDKPLEEQIAFIESIQTVDSLKHFAKLSTEMNFKGKELIEELKKLVDILKETVKVQKSTIETYEKVFASVSSHSEE